MSRIILQEDGNSSLPSWKGSSCQIKINTMDLFTIGIFVTVGGGSDDSNTLWATSYNGYGQLGLGDNTARDRNT